MMCGICRETVEAGQLNAHRSTCQRPRRPSSLRVDLPWTKPPLTQNRSSRADNVYAKAARVRIAKETAGFAIRAANLPRLAGANITLHFRPATRHRRDADGTCATLKVCLDALIAEGVLTDDSWVEVPFSGHRIHEPDGTPAAMWLAIDPLGERP